MTATLPFELRPGDVLLYRGSGVYGWLIRLKTWHPIGHVEVYVGDRQSAASRDGKGVNIYPLRMDGLAYVLRPIEPFDLAAALRWYEREAKGLPYGWLDLLQFVGQNVNRKGVVCSPFATQLLRAGGIPIFNDEPAEKIAPFQFLTSERLVRIWNVDVAAALAL